MSRCSIRPFISVRRVSDYYIEDEICLNLQTVTYCKDSHYSDKKGQHPAVQVYGPFGELLLAESYYYFVEKWQDAVEKY